MRNFSKSTFLFDSVVPDNFYANRFVVYILSDSIGNKFHGGSSFV